MSDQAVSVLADLIAKQNITVSGSLSLKTTSSFVVPNVITSSDSLYDVDVALHRIDDSLQQFTANIANAFGGVVHEYNSRRYIFTGSLDSGGSAKINLTNIVPSGSTYFTTSSVNNISVDILLDTENNGKYKNDLVSYQLYQSSSNLYLEIDAAAASNVNYRLLVVNEETLDELPSQDGYKIIAGPQGPSGSQGSVGPAGNNAKSYITVVSNASTNNTSPTIVTNFLLTPTKAPSGFNIEFTGFNEKENSGMIIQLYDFISGSVLGSATITSTLPTTASFFVDAPIVNPQQYELRYYSSGSANNYIFLQTAILELL